MRFWNTPSSFAHGAIEVVPRLAGFIDEEDFPFVPAGEFGAMAMVAQRHFSSEHGQLEKEKSGFQTSERKTDNRKEKREAAVQAEIEAAVCEKDTSAPAEVRPAALGFADAEIPRKATI